MAIAPIGALSPVVTPPAPVGAGATGAAPGLDATNFSSSLSNAVDSLQQSQGTAATDESQLAAGQGNLADTMIAASEANLQTQVANDLLTKAISSYNDIMNMSF